MKERNYSADLIRCVACLFVVSVHFFLNSGFYSVPVGGAVMIAGLGLRSLFVICVSMFIMLTGFLQNKKELSRDYYKGGKKTLFIYLGASLACGIFRLVRGQYTSVSDIIFGTLRFNSAQYGWYLEMYFGLFLLIPFLNLIWNNLGTKRKKQVLLLTLFILTVLPMGLNIFRFRDAAWWAQPSSNAAYDVLVPQFWKGIYPLTYYFTGAYMREFPLKLTRPQCLFLTLMSVSAAALFNWWRSAPGAFVWGTWNDWHAPLTLVTAVSVFGFLQKTDLSAAPRAVKAALRFFSSLTLGIYLLSFIFDSLYYPILARLVPDASKRLFALPVTVPAVFLSAAAASFALELLYKGAGKLAGLLRPAKKE